MGITIKGSHKTVFDLGSAGRGLGGHSSWVYNLTGGHLFPRSLPSPSRFSCLYLQFCFLAFVPEALRFLIKGVTV